MAVSVKVSLYPEAPTAMQCSHSNVIIRVLKEITHVLVRTYKQNLEPNLFTEILPLHIPHLNTVTCKYKTKNAMEFKGKKQII